MTADIPRYLAAGTSDQGSVRDNNEDRVHTDEVRGIFLVVDGMGGHEAGEQAAAIAVERIRARLERQTGSVEQRVREAITLANNGIYEVAQNKPEWKGMACVLTVAVIEDGQVTVGHVGDSRLYRIKRGLIQKVTNDHSPVGEREDSGEITEAEAMKHPRRNEVYRDVGTEEHTPDDDDFIEIRRIPFEPDGALLLCSDGLSDAISSQQILNIVQKHAGDRWAAIRALIAAATQVGKDNISAILVEGEKFAASFGRQRPGKRPVSRRQRPPIITDPQPVQNTPPPRTIIARPHVGWYARGPAWLLYGLILGALLSYGALQFLVPKAPPQIGPQTLFVKDTETISGALAKARPGDTVSVMPGTYTEPVHLKDGVDLVAQSTHEAAIEGTVGAENVRRGRFEGFRVHTLGDIGVQIVDSDIILERNEVSAAKVAGVEFGGTSRGAIVACWIHDNAGAGIVVKDSAAPVIGNNILISNGTAAKALRPGLLIRSSIQPRVVANIFLGNGAEAMWLPKPDQNIIDRNYFTVAGKPDKRPKFRIVPLAEGSSERR